MSACQHQLLLPMSKTTTKIVQEFDDNLAYVCRQKFPNLKSVLLFTCERTAEAGLTLLSKIATVKGPCDSNSGETRSWFLSRDSCLVVTVNPFLIGIAPKRLFCVRCNELKEIIHDEKLIFILQE